MSIASWAAARRGGNLMSDQRVSVTVRSRHAALLLRIAGARRSLSTKK
jgi:hypothetical protein